MAGMQLTGSIINTYGIKGKQFQTVWCRWNWTDDWEYVPWLWPDTAVESAAPSIPNAEFTWHAGYQKNYYNTGFDSFYPLNIQDAFIQIRVHSEWGWFAAWTGIVQNETNTNPGLNPNNGYQCLDQKITAVGLEFILMRRRINNSIISTDIDTINRPLVFNEQSSRGPSYLGNRSATADSRGVYWFGGTDSWTNLDIANYVLINYVPTATPFYLVGELDALSQIVETHNLFGMTVYDALNQLIDRRRGLSWRVIQDQENNIAVWVFSTIADPISFGGVDIPANRWQDVINFDGYPDVHPSFTTIRSETYDRVIVDGSAIKVCSSYSFDNATLEEGWSIAEEEAYEADTDENRSTDTYNRVFTFYRVPNDWPWTYYSLEDDTAQNVLPTVNYNGDVDFTDTTQLPYMASRRFLPWLPDQVTTDADNAEPEFRSPFVLIAVPGTPAVYAYVDLLTAVDDRDINDDYDVRLSDREMGFYVKGQKNHTLGLNQFTGRDADDTATAEVDYATMIATMLVETDAVLRVSYLIPNNLGSNAGKDLIIHVPDAEYWYIAEGTVADVVDGELQFYVPGAQRDDTDRLRAIAAAALAWYSVPRNIIEYSCDELLDMHPVGMMVRGIGNSAGDYGNVGTVVTERAWNFIEGGGGVTRVRTGFSELDFTR